MTQARIIQQIKFVQSKMLKLQIMTLVEASNRTARIKHECKKTIVLNCHRCLINDGFEKMNNI